MAQVDAAPEYREYTSAERWIVLVALMLGTLMMVIDTSIVNVAIPNMMGNLGATLTQISWVSTGYIIANVIMLPLTGWFSSYFGRKRFVVTSIIVFTVASFLCGTAHSLNLLVFYRILQGAGGAALISTAQATMMEIFPPEQLGMVQAIYGIGLMVGPTIGPTLGGWITDNYNWPMIFFINIPSASPRRSSRSSSCTTPTCRSGRATPSTSWGSPCSPSDSAVYRRCWRRATPKGGSSPLSLSGWRSAPCWGSSPSSSGN